MYRCCITFKLFLFTLLTLWHADVAAADVLKILYQDRPPYYVTNEDGTIGGIVSGPVANALSNAGIETQWVVRPGNNQIEKIKSNTGHTCSPGWFKKPEREAFAKFSEPVYQDQPQVIVARSDNAHRITHVTLDELFGDPELRFGTKLGYSYGGFIDDLRATRQPIVIETAQDAAGMIRMLLGGRFDYMVAAPEEFYSQVERLGIAGEDIISLRMRDIPPGNKRYLMCSKQVSDDIIARFNAALTQQ